MLFNNIRIIRSLHVERGVILLEDSWRLIYVSLCNNYFLVFTLPTSPKFFQSSINIKVLLIKQPCTLVLSVFFWVVVSSCVPCMSYDCSIIEGLKSDLATFSFLLYKICQTLYKQPYHIITKIAYLVCRRIAYAFECVIR